MSLSHEEMNALVYRYLQESGFLHSAFTFAYECMLNKANLDPMSIPTGALIMFVQKGLAFVNIEQHLDEKGVERTCDSEFGINMTHVCHKPAGDTETKRRHNVPKGKSYPGEVFMTPPPRLKSGMMQADTEVAPEDVIKLTDHQSEVFMCQWNPRHDMLASGSGDSTGRIWMMPAGLKGRPESSIVLKHSAGIGDKNKDVTTLDWNREGSVLATGSYDGNARLWTKEGALISVLKGHEGPVFSTKWNEKGNYLLTGSSDKSAIVWDARTGCLEQRFSYHEAPALDVDWKDNTTFATCSTDKAINILTVGETFPRQTFTGHTDEVNAIKWDPKGRILASCSDDFTVKIWKPNSAKCIHDLRDHRKEIYTIRWSPLAGRKTLLASASFDSTVKLWDVEVGKCVSTFSRDPDPVYSVAFSPSGDYLASGSFAGHLYIWRVSDGTLMKSYQGQGDVFEVTWNCREDRIAACFSTSEVVVMDLRL